MPLSCSRYPPYPQISAQNCKDVNTTSYNNGTLPLSMSPSNFTISRLRLTCRRTPASYLIGVVVWLSFSSFLRWRKVYRQPPIDQRSLPEEEETKRRNGINDSVIHRKASSSAIGVAKKPSPSSYNVSAAVSRPVDSDGRIFATEESGAAETLLKWYATLRLNAHVTMTTDFRRKTLS